MSQDPNKLTQKPAKELFQTKLPQPVLKKVELKPEKPIQVNIGFWEALWLLVKSVVRNKALDAMEGKEAEILVTPLKLFSSIGGWWKLGVIIIFLIIVIRIL